MSPLPPRRDQLHRTPAVLLCFDKEPVSHLLLKRTIAHLDLIDTRIFVESFLFDGQHVQRHGRLLQSIVVLFDEMPLTEEDLQFHADASLVDRRETKPDQHEEQNGHAQQREDDQLQRRPVDVFGEENTEDRREKHPEDDDRHHE